LGLGGGDQQTAGHERRRHEDQQDAQSVHKLMMSLATDG